MQRIIKKMFEFMGVYCFGGFLYMLIEILYRGRTSLEMFFVAGFCALFIMLINDVMTYDMDFIVQCLCCSMFITMLEYLCGIICNKDYHIWDYRNLPYNIDGQICLYFSFIWFLLSVVFIPFLDYIEWKVFDYEINNPPYYKMLNKIIFKFK